MDGFNPNEIGVSNGNYFGLPFTKENAKVVLIPVPWDVTTSYRAGTSSGPRAILEASLQIDLYDLEYADAWKAGIASLGQNKSLKKQGKALREVSERIINHLENGGKVTDPEIEKNLMVINASCQQLNEWVYSESWMLLEEGKIPGIVGGEHSVPLGLLKALAEKNTEFGILQIDAHADLRVGYEGFEFSHASIMNHAINLKSVSKLVQVGIRDLCEDEFQLIKSNKLISTFDDYMISRSLLNGNTWAKLCLEIVNELPEKVYLSFDIDGLDPSLCPNTGTPVPGGLSFQQATLLLKTLHESGRKIIGFDLCEVAPAKNNEIDQITGARMLYKLCNLAISTNL